MSSGATLRVVVADDHPLYRDGLVSALDALGTVEVVGVAADGAEAVRLSADLSPDVVLMDLAMPVCNGVEATQQITAAQPDVAVLVLTMLEGDESVVAAVKAGARGYLVKGADRADIASALEAVSRGQVVFGASAAASALGRIKDPPAAGRRSSAFPQLTDRELEVLELLAQGLSNATIARRLYLSTKTVRNHVSNVLGKLGVPDREAAAELARAHSHTDPHAHQS